MNKKAEIEAIEGIKEEPRINNEDIQKVKVKRKTPNWVKTIQKYTSKLYQSNKSYQEPKSKLDYHA